MLLFLAVFFLYSAAGPGNLPGDTEVRWSVSRQLLRHGTVALEDSQQTRNCAVGVDGRRYTFYGLGQSVCLLPFAGFGLLLERFTSCSPEKADLLAQFLASIVLFPLLGALLVWVFYRLIVLLGGSERAAVLTAMLLAFATMTFHYAVITQEQTQIALFLLAAVWFMVKNQRQRRFLYAWLLCLMLGVAIFYRLPSVLTALPIFLAAAIEELISVNKKVQTLGKWLIAGLSGTGVFLGFWCWFNYVRFGSILETGYGISTETALGGHALFESRPWMTLPAMLFSPGKSIFLYNPILLLLPFCVAAFCRKHRSVALASLTAVVVSFVFHSFYACWAGDYAWCLRFQTAVLPLLILPLYLLFEKPLPAIKRSLLAVVIAVSVGIQLVSVVYNFNLEFTQNGNHSLIPDGYVWEGRQSHLVMRLNNIKNHISGNRDFRSADVADENPLELRKKSSEEAVRRAYSVNFFPFKAASNAVPAKMFYGLLGLWLILLLGFGLTLYLLFRLIDIASANKLPTLRFGGIHG